MSADQETAARIARGHEDAYASLFQEVYAPLCTFANSMVAAPDIAEELVQEVFVRLWRNRNSLDVQTSLRAYLYRAVRNAALNHLDRRRTEQRWYQTAVAEAVDRTAAHPVTGTERLEAEQVSQELDRAIQRLPARCREVVELRWRHGLKHAAIAETLGISVKGVENHLTRGLKALQKDLAERLPP